jgi:hypothetical protein
VPPIDRLLPPLVAALIAAGCLVPIGDTKDGEGSGGAGGSGADAGSSGTAGSSSGGNGGSSGGATGGSAGAGNGGSSGASGSGGAGASGSGGAGASAGRSCAVPAASSNNDPDLPAPFFDLTLPAVSGASHAVGAGQDLQTVLDKLAPGDEVVLEAGAKFVGNFVLRKLASDQWVTIRSSASGSLPSEGKRVTLADGSKMATLSSANAAPALTSNEGAHHYRFIGVRFGVEPGVMSNSLVTLGSSSATTLEAQPHHVVFDRCIFQGEPSIGSLRGIEMNSAHTAVLDSHFADFKSATNDSDALSMWNGPGPFLIHNNHIEASWKSLRIGGKSSSISGLVPSDVAICNNHITKSLSWKIDDPSFAGTDWRVHDLVVIHSARRLLLSGNVIDHGWNEDGYGTAISISTINDSGAHTWATADQITIAYNVIRDVGSGLRVDPSSGNYPDAGVGSLRFAENLVYDVGVGAFKGHGRLAWLNGPVTSFSLTDNTALAQSSVLFLVGPLDSLVVRDNLFGPTSYGIFGNNAGMGTSALEKFAAAYSVTHNVFVGALQNGYPSGNFFPKTLPEVGFVSVASDDYHLLASSPYIKAASDGGAIGADIDQILAITAGVAP